MGEPGHPAGIAALILEINSADGHRSTVFDLDLGLHMLGIDCGARGGFRAHAVFGDVDTQHDMVIRRDVRNHFEFQRGTTKLHGGHAPIDFRLIRQFGALLDQGAHPVGRHHTRAGNNPPMPLRFQGAQLEHQFPAIAGAKECGAQGGRRITPNAAGGQIVNRARGVALYAARRRRGGGGVAARQRQTRAEIAAETFIGFDNP